MEFMIFLYVLQAFLQIRIPYLINGNTSYSHCAFIMIWDIIIFYTEYSYPIGLRYYAEYLPSSNQTIFCNTSNQGGLLQPLPRFSELNPL